MLSKKDSLKTVHHYHQETKHHLSHFARSLGYMDWANQPNPFRRFKGAPVLELARSPFSSGPSFDELFEKKRIPCAPIEAQTISQFFYDSLALSAWKQIPNGNKWSLRINPSSGNLHPTEGYLIIGATKGISQAPKLFHYAPFHHVLEERLTLEENIWNEIKTQLPPDAFLVGLTSIYSRESWKYGERAFRYCQHDVGHAIACLYFSARCLGWHAEVIPAFPSNSLSLLLGLGNQTRDEAEHPDCLLMIYPKEKGDSNPLDFQLSATSLQKLEKASFLGEPNKLSKSHHPWEIIDQVSESCLAGPIETEGLYKESWQEKELPAKKRTVKNARTLIHQRRSAVGMDGRTALPANTFFQILEHLLPSSPLFQDFNLKPFVSLGLLIHRVNEVSPGLYILARHPSHLEKLKASFSKEWLWKKERNIPKTLPLYLLKEMDCQEEAQLVSCHQEIAGRGAFAIGMLAEFLNPLEKYGSWLYPRLFWETGLIGQVLYLEAEAAGLQGTGIGCFFDDEFHKLLGLENKEWQSLYHFTIGGGESDSRLQTLAPYSHLEEK